MRFGSQSDLVARIKNLITTTESRPLAILCGSGITIPAVPSVNKIINSLRSALDADEQAELDLRLKQFSTDGERYQEAFDFLSFRRPPEFRDKVIRLSTLAAYNIPKEKRASAIPKDLSTFESNVDGWNLPDGVSALGRIWSGLARGQVGPIVTTNFDPLCEISIRKAGGGATPLIANDDSTFIRNMRAIEDTTILHLHGYWKDSNTLSMNDQLSLERPALAGGLRELLRTYTFLVVGYGGWLDIFTKQIALMIREQRSSELDILWTAYSTGATLEADFGQNDFFLEMKKSPGNIVFYENIDSNVFFPTLERSISGSLHHSSDSRVPKNKGNLLGWTAVTIPEDSGRDSVMETSRAISFFDGRLPSWKDASSSYIPKRDVVGSVTNYLINNIREKKTSLTSIIGPSGEGKSTALKQIALVLKKRYPESQILFQSDPNFVNAKEIVDLPDGPPYILIIDDAYGSIDRLKVMCEKLNESNKSGVHIIIACRDSDWRNTGGAIWMWSRFIAYRSFPLHGMSRPDAAALVQAWERIGSRALRHLATIEGTEARISHLVSAASDARFRTGGAFLGALLVTRFGPDLTVHVHDMMERASHWSIPSSSNADAPTLLNALVFAALPQNSGVYQMNFAILARCLGIEESELNGHVLPRLGAEAAVSYDQKNILIRHHLIAALIIEHAPNLGIDLVASIKQIVKIAVGLQKSSQILPTINQLIYISRYVANSELSIAAAQAAVEADPNRLSYRTSLAAAYRKNNRLDLAIAEGISSISIIRSADDPQSCRAVFTEWGVAEGQYGNWARNAVLAAISIQDGNLLGPIDRDKSEYSISCLMLAFRHLLVETGDEVYLKALAVSIAWSELLGSNSRNVSWIKDAETIVESHGGIVSSFNESNRKDLTNGCRLALSQVEEEFGSGMPAVDFKFSELERIVKAQDRW